MQTKPRFERSTFIEQYPVVTDDTGNTMMLTLVEATPQSVNGEFVVSPYRFWVVIGKRQEKWGNGVVSYEDHCYWKAKDKEMIKTEVNGLVIEEYAAGGHFMFPQDGLGLKTSFRISKP